MCFHMLSRLSEGVPQLSKADVEEAMIDNEAMKCYLNFASNGTLPKTKVTYTSNFEALRTALSNNKCVRIIGPKGAGKTVLCMITYLVFLKNYTCLYLTEASMTHHPLNVRYFQLFIEKHRKCYPEEKIQEITCCLKDKTNFLDGVYDLLHCSTVKPYLFVDLSTFRSSGSNVRKLLQLVVSCDYLIISISSGLDHFIINKKNPDTIMISCLRNILANCEPVTVRNFTESEAEKYIRINRGKLSFSEIKNISGTNPYLLSLARHVDSTVEYSSMIDGLVVKFISTNLDGLTSNPKSLVLMIKKCVEQML